jgi:hypothetical protein
MQGLVLSISQLPPGESSHISELEELEVTGTVVAGADDPLRDVVPVSSMDADEASSARATAGCSTNVRAKNALTRLGIDERNHENILLRVGVSKCSNLM